MKVSEKVSFNIASEASYVYILGGQKFIENAKNGEFLKTWNLRSDSITRQVNFKKDKNWWKMPKFENSNASF